MEGVQEARAVHVFAPGINHPMPGTIVRAWDQGGEAGTINVLVFPDGGNDSGPGNGIEINATGDRYAKVGASAFPCMLDSDGKRVFAFWASVQHRSHVLRNAATSPDADPVEALTLRDLMDPVEAASLTGRIFWDWPPRV